MITRENLAILKFAHDMSLDPNNAQDVVDHGNAVYLACVIVALYPSLNPNTRIQRFLAHGYFESSSRRCKSLESVAAP